MADNTPSLALAEIEALLAQAEADLARLGRPPDPADPADPARCLEIWIAALRTLRDGGRLSPAPRLPFPRARRRPPRRGRCRPLRAAS